ARARRHQSGRDGAFSRGYAGARKAGIAHADCWLASSRRRLGQGVETKEFFQLGPIASWMSAHAGDYYRSSNTMYYMFSGPDFLYAYTFFPDANTYILAGLEPVGHVPDVSRMNPAALVNDLTPLRNSMSTLLITHYFVTEEMKASLGRSELGGTVPILYVFLARLGCNILETAHVSAPAEGVRITFTHGGNRQTLYYFKTDLSGGNSPFLRW